VLFEGVYVPSKAFGEFVEQAYRTPHISAAELAGLRAAGTELVVLDSRPLDEYRKMCIPGGIDVPGAELVHRIHDLAPDPATLGVANCAGRTRSIIGAQSLINAGIANPVVALENGTMGWTLAGVELEHGQARTAPPPSAAARSFASAAAAQVAKRFGVTQVAPKTLARWREDPTRTLYLCDVRSPDEYAAGHLSGARCTPGGQLVQATDGYIGTHGARVVLVDDDGVRATMTASWLVQIGRWEVAVLEGGLDGPLETGAERSEVLGLAPDDALPAIAPAELARLAPGREVQVLDLADSRSWRSGHVPGAMRLTRGRIGRDWPGVPAAPRYALTSEDGVVACLALPEVAAAGAAAVVVLAGGTAAWRAAGLPLETAPAPAGDDPDDDVYLRPHDRAPEQIAQAMRDYLQWETALMPQLKRDGTLHFAAHE
jgi:rhodanese-related sulfurtransferase